MKKEDLLFKLLKNSLVDECLVVGDTTVKNIIKDSLNKQENIMQNYAPSEYGHNISIYEAIVLVFASIQALDCALNIVQKIWKKGTDKSIVKAATKETLVENKIPLEMVDEILDEIIKWLADEDN